MQRGGDVVGRLVTLAALACLALPASAAVPQPWPSRPIRIVVAQAPGGPPDLIARHVAEPLARGLAGSVVVENRPGASGIIGVDEVARAAPDGYTLLIATQSTHALVPHVMASVTYDPVRDFVPVANLFRSVKAVWVPASLPVRSLRELFDYALARPGQLNFASGGVGSSNHVDAELLMSVAGVSLVHVPYNGPRAALAGVASGDAQLMIVSITTGMPLLQAGRVRALAVLDDRRSPLMPTVPTAAEQGYPALGVTAWIGLVAPAGTPASIVADLHRVVERTLHSPATLAWAEAQGLEIAAGSPEAFGQEIANDFARWGPVIRRARLRVE